MFFVVAIVVVNETVNQIILQSEVFNNAQTRSSNPISSFM
jgi:hypothetical protein